MSRICGPISPKPSQTPDFCGILCRLRSNGWERVPPWIPCPNLWYPRLPPKIGDIKKKYSLSPNYVHQKSRARLEGVLVYRYKKHLPGMQPNVSRECFRLLREIVYFYLNVDFGFPLFWWGQARLFSADFLRLLRFLPFSFFGSSMAFPGRKNGCPRLMRLAYK